VPSPQKHSTIRDDRRFVWYTERLWSLSRALDAFDVPLSTIRELDQNWFGTGREATLREVASHCGRINAADLEWPIILNADGSLMDGGHRVCKALLEGRRTVRAVQFAVMPDPDEVHPLVT
jgi:hypothetical protein